MFRNMEYVYCVYKERSFSKAAEKLHIAQPSLSAMIRKEEEQAGAPIFERKTRPVSLTPFGIEFIRGIEQIYELENHLHDMADELRTLQSGIVSIGGSNLSSDYIVPERIAAFKTKYPNVTLRASEASTIQCKQMLDAGDLDLVITNRPLDTESYERIVCYRENLLLAVPSHFAVNEGLRNYQLTQAERGEMIFLLPEETVCLLSKLQSKEHIEIEVKMDELDLTSAESKATYEEIREYVFEHTGLKVSHLYIAQVKQKYGIIERENYNKPKSENAKQPQCPPEKEKAITEALKHFGMIL